MSIHLTAPDAFTTLVANLTRPAAWSGTVGDDLAPWEAPLPDPAAPATPAVGPVTARLGGFRHAALLVAGQDSQVIAVYRTWQHLGDPVDLTDPHVGYRIGQDGLAHRIVSNPERSLWRDLDALLADPELVDGNRTETRPAVLVDAVGLDDDVFATVTISAFSFYADRSQAQQVGWSSERTPPVLRLLAERDPAAAARIAAHVAAAETAGDRLRYALQLVEDVHLEATKANGARPAKPTKASGKRVACRGLLAPYWAAAQDQFWGDVLHDADATPDTYLVLARHAFDDATSQHRRPAALKTIATAQRRLYPGKDTTS